MDNQRKNTWHWHRYRQIKQAAIFKPFSSRCHTWLHFPILNQTSSKRLHGISPRLYHLLRVWCARLQTSWLPDATRSSIPRMTFIAMASRLFLSFPRWWHLTPSEPGGKMDVHTTLFCSRATSWKGHLHSGAHAHTVYCVSPQLM